MLRTSRCSHLLHLSTPPAYGTGQVSSCFEVLHLRRDQNGTETAMATHQHPTAVDFLPILSLVRRVYLFLRVMCSLWFSDMPVVSRFEGFSAFLDCRRLSRDRHLLLEEESI